MRDSSNSPGPAGPDRPPLRWKPARYLREHAGTPIRVFAATTIPQLLLVGLISALLLLWSQPFWSSGVDPEEIIFADDFESSEPPPPPPPPNKPPTITSAPITAGTVNQPYTYTVQASDPDGDPLTFSFTTAPSGMTIGTTSGVIFWTPQAAAVFDVIVRVTDGQGGKDSQAFKITVDQFLPNPAAIAPPVDLTVSTTVFTGTEFLYTGSNPVQAGVQPDTINPVRAAVVRGQVMTREGAALPSVRITVKSHPEFGQTLSREDGRFDLVVNGGGWFTLDYQASGFLPAQRTLNVPWQDFTEAPEMALIPLDPIVTQIDLAGLTEVVAAEGSVMEDDDGARQARALFKPGTSAEIVLADGSTVPLNQLSVRATEYTVGPNGPQAMPGELPPTSGYTYAVELSADEALAAGATRVQFNQPVASYVENFLDFPIGGSVPAAYYDRDMSAWVPSKNGRVIQIVGVTAGLAEIDIDGSGTANTPAELAELGLDTAERQQLATLYAPGTSLWRVEIDHFTPWDYNWPYGPPDDAVAPSSGIDRVNDSDLEDEICEYEGSIIECQNQVLGESVGIPGTPYTLNYRSNRVSGYKAARTVSIPLSGANIPNSLKRIQLSLYIAGQVHSFNFPAQPEVSTTFTWDGKDAYGRTILGTQILRGTIGYVYDAVYRTPAAFEASFGNFGDTALEASFSRQEIIISQNLLTEIGGWDARGQGLGGWTLDVHHLYDRTSRTVYLGNGSRRSAQGIGSTVTTVAGRGVSGSFGDGGPATSAFLNNPREIALAPDGSLYIADRSNHRIRKVGPNGVITTVAGTGSSGFTGDGGPAVDARLNQPYGVAVALDGSIYIGDTDNNRVRRVNPEGIITTIAGTGIAGYNGDGSPATEAQLDRPRGIRVSPEAGVYIVEQIGERVRYVRPDGQIHTVAGTGSSGFGGDGGPAGLAQLHRPHALTIGPDGSVYLADTNNHRIRQIWPDGTIETVAGTGIDGFSGDGGPAVLAQLGEPKDVAIGADGSLYISCDNNDRIRRVSPDGIITTFAGTGIRSTGLDGDLALRTDLNRVRGLEVAQDGSIYFADRGSHRILRVRRPLPGFATDEIVVPSEDGSALYGFAPDGRHLRTLNSLTGAVLREFSYHPSGLLSQITDGDGNVTVIQRDSDGRPTAIVSPFGHTTSLVTSLSGWLVEVITPANETISLDYVSDGLLVSTTDPLGRSSSYAYNAQGLLNSVTDRSGHVKTLARFTEFGAFETTLTTPLERTSRYRVEQLLDGSRILVNTFPSNTSTSVMQAAGVHMLVNPDDSLVTRTLRPDPRFGIMAPLSELTIETPGGRSHNLSLTQEVTLHDPGNPLSLSTKLDTLLVNGREWKTLYDAGTRIVSRSTPENRTSMTVIDERGRVISSQTDGLSPSVFEYAASGGIANVQIGEGEDTRLITLNYGQHGWIESIVDPIGRMTSFHYDPVGRILGRTLPDGRLTNYQYDTNGNLLGIMPPGRPAHQFTYTELDQPASYLGPDIGNGQTVTKYIYDDDRALVEVHRPGGEVLHYEYDDGGRLISLTVSGRKYEYAYDQGDRLKSITDPDGGVISYIYDGPLLVNTTWTGEIMGTVESTYDNAFRVTSVSVGGNPIGFEYDDDDHLIKAGELVLTRNLQHGLLDGTQLGSISDSIIRNQFGEVSEYTVLHEGSALFQLVFTRDKLGRVVHEVGTIDANSSDTTYGYDLAGRLVSVHRDDILVESYSYDENGNRLSGPDGLESYVYDDQDRLLSFESLVGTAQYEWKPNGELLKKTVGDNVTEYDYDVIGNLRSVALSNGLVIDYQIDGRNRRVGKLVDGVRVQGFLYQDHVKPVAELDGNGNIVSQFIYAGGVNVPAYMIREGQLYRILTDGLGSPRLVVNALSGNVEQRLDYDSFGNVLLDSNPGFQPFGFSGGLYDPHTGLVRFRWRDYDSQMGRWTARDPIAFGGAQMNLYVYVMNDPINLIDIDGLGADSDAGWGMWDLYSKGRGLVQDVKQWIGYASDAKETVERINRMNELIQNQDEPGGERGRRFFKEALELCKTVIGKLPGANRFVKKAIDKSIDFSSGLLDAGADVIEQSFRRIEEESGFSVPPEAQPSPYIPDGLLNGTPWNRERSDLANYVDRELSLL